jgi:hypothetical protein
LVAGAIYCVSGITEKVLDGIGKATDTVVHAYEDVHSAIAAKKYELT